MSDISEAEAISGIRERLFAAVDKRMMSDRPIGCLVSGGVDSSLIAAMVAKHYDSDTLHTFNVGLKVGASDREYARMVANHIGSVHHEVTLTNAEALDLILDTVLACESFDTTTILSIDDATRYFEVYFEVDGYQSHFNGDVIDEASGSFCRLFQERTIGRSLSERKHSSDEGNSFVRRIACRPNNQRLWSRSKSPLADLEFLKFYMAIPAKLRKPQQGVEKYLLRKSFGGPPSARSNLAPQRSIQRRMFIARRQLVFDHSTPCGAKAIR